jgi:hypothetical protein
MQEPSVQLPRRTMRLLRLEYILPSIGGICGDGEEQRNYR